ncbi:hypothetical protein OH784_09500 [Ectobacillus funiculus]|jgi:methyltransferase|uniref:isoprenylcysteine carboxyl methyltransferase family protein n=1 Tax=Ectobacillus funiculus TaxID=137993 RepID=UPI00397BC735
MTFFSFFAFVVVQRLAELLLARRNEQYLKKRGALEFGKGHYKYIVLLHMLFLVFIVAEVTYLKKAPSPMWPVLLALFIGTQFLRVWAIASLGVYWNTKILVLPHSKLVPKGPYRFMRHPNYIVVMMEFWIIPILFQAYITAIVCSLLNMLVLSVRIREEERALQELTNYKQSFQKISRFIP